MADSNKNAAPPVPLKGWPGVRADILSGFLVFLIALPLCLAIANASNFPPITGIWTAVAGGLIATWVSNSELTIKGPAAGLLVIVAGAVTGMSEAFGDGLPPYEKWLLGYRMALGVAVVAGAIQIMFGLLRFGKLGDFFPLAAVHGLLAAIGIIIISKQIYLVFGIEMPDPSMKPLGLLATLPANFANMNPAIALIGIVSLVILFGLPAIKNKYVRRIPSPMVVILIAIPLGAYLDLSHEHKYLLPSHWFQAYDDADKNDYFTEYKLSPKYLMNIPSVLSKDPDESPPLAARKNHRDADQAFYFPDFSGIFSLVGLQYILLFSLIGSLESMLSAKAVDLLDPHRRKTSLDRDLTAIGVGNTAVAFIGGLPMISEIVRSSANITNGAQSRLANCFHGLFLLAFVLFLPGVIRMIPLAALAAMLVFTGFRLAHPREFIKTWKIGKEQLAVFVTTIVVTLLTDMLIGVFAGVVVEFILHMLHGMPFRSAWKSSIQMDQSEESLCRITVRDAAVFTNWLQLKARIVQLGPKAEVTLDFSDVQLIDHSVMEKLHELEQEFERAGGKLHVVGLDGHLSLSSHPQASRKKNSVNIKNEAIASS